MAIPIPKTGMASHGVLPRWRDPNAWLKSADVFAILTVASLPWSTSLPAIFATIWLLVLLPAIDIREFVRLLRRPACYLPIVLFALALIGTLWSIAPWSQRFQGVNPVGKLLMLPFIFYHFQRSSRGPWVFGAFLCSCTLLMLLSWLISYYPHLAFRRDAMWPGVPVKNYIDQSQEFALCIAGLAWGLLAMARRGRLVYVAVLAVIALGFIFNMMFVVVSRTALVTLPLMLGVFALLHMKRRAILAAGAAVAVAVALLWVASPNLHNRIASIGVELESYREANASTSAGLRLEFWRKSLGFFAEAPVLGHGTGSTRLLFERAAANEVGAAAEIIGNPHNQTFNVAVQWGLAGVLILYLMWLAHLDLFSGSAAGPGLAAWIGLAVVVQNFASSLFNSHLFDFHEGWMYVLGVGVAGGMLMAAGRQTTRDHRRPASEPSL